MTHSNIVIRLITLLAIGASTNSESLLCSHNNIQVFIYIIRAKIYLFYIYMDIVRQSIQTKHKIARFMEMNDPHTTILLNFHSSNKFIWIQSTVIHSNMMP